MSKTKLQKGIYPPYYIANNIIDIAQREEIGLSNLSLQKIMYFLQGYYLVLVNKPLSNEPFQPWDYGPVIPTIYHYYKRYGRGQILDYCKEYDPIEKDFVAYKIGTSDKSFVDALGRVWKTYGAKDPFELVHLSHKYGGAWHKARENDSLVINDEDIKKEFAEIVKQYS